MIVIKQQGSGFYRFPQGFFTAPAKFNQTMHIKVMFCGIFQNHLYHVHKSYTRKISSHLPVNMLSP